MVPPDAEGALGDGRAPSLPGPFPAPTGDLLQVVTETWDADGRLSPKESKWASADDIGYEQLVFVAPDGGFRRTAHRIPRPTPPAPLRRRRGQKRLEDKINPHQMLTARRAIEMMQADPHLTINGAAYRLRMVGRERTLQRWIQRFRETHPQ
jgi:hypothetical protein